MRLKALGMGVLLVLAVAAPGGAQAPPAVPADVARVIGDALVNQDLSAASAQCQTHAAAMEQDARRMATDAVFAFALGFCRAIAERPAPAAEAMGHAWRLAPDNAVYGIQYALTLKMSFQPLASRRVLEQLTARFPAAPGIASMLAAVYSEIQDYTASRGAYERLLSGAPPESDDRAIALAFLGEAHLYLGDVTQAEKLLREALALRPQLWMATLRLGEALILSGRPADAIDVLTAVKTKGEAFYLRGLALERLRRRDEAAAAFTEALGRQVGQVVEDSGRDHFVLNRIYRRLGQPAPAFFHESLARHLGFTRLAVGDP